MEEMTTQSLRKKASKRIEWLDALKGVAIIAVVFGHSLLGYTENNAFGEYNDFFFQLKDWIYIWHMPFFMCLSGFSFSLAYYRDNKVDTLIGMRGYIGRIIENAGCPSNSTQEYRTCYRIISTAKKAI